MSVTSGFFNSLNGDRRYNAEQMSAIFDGIINDGVFASIGTAFGVRANGDYNITVGIGRAWFNSTWLYNDSILPLTTDVSELLLGRYDAVIIEIDRTESVRRGSIKLVKGEPSNNPQYPTLVKTNGKYQYPLAYIRHKAGATEITQTDIINMIGTSSCPYVTAILEVNNIDNIVAQWEAEWDEWTEEEQNAFNEWFAEIREIFSDTPITALADRVLKLETVKLESEPAVDFEEAQTPEFQENLNTLTDKVKKINVTSEKVEELPAVKMPLDEVVEAIQKKGEETIASIPADYTSLVTEVAEVKSDLSKVEDNLSTDLNGICEVGIVSGYPVRITDAIVGSVASCATESETVTRIGHNMVKIKEYYSEDYYGVTYHCDSENGTVTVSGTVTGGNAVIAATANSSIHLEAGTTYFIGGNPNGYDTSNAWIRLYDAESGSYVGNLGEFTPDTDMDVSIRIRINNGLTVENLVFTPVVCLAEEVQISTPNELSLLNGENFIFNGDANEMAIEYRTGVKIAEKKFSEEISGAYTKSFSVITNTMEFMKNPWVLSCLAYYESASGEQPTIQFQLVDENENELYYSMPYVVGSDKEYYRREWRIPASREHYNRVKISFVIPSGVTLYIKDFTNKETGRFRSGDIGVRYHAHQGFSGLTASSTIDSFQSASEVGFTSCITIPKFTSDGVGVCFHDDDTIRKEVRYADGSVIASGSADDKAVSEFTYEELMQFDKGIKKDAIYAGQKIATIDDFFRICSMTGMSPIFSVHGTPQFYLSGDGVANFTTIRKLAEKWRVLDKLWIKSGDPNVQKASLSVFGTDIGGYIMIQGASSTWDVVNQASLCGFDFSKHKVVMEYFYSAITEEKIQNAIDGGFYAVSVATTGDGISGAEMTRLINLGVSEFTIDHHCSMGLDW